VWCGFCGVWQIKLCKLSWGFPFLFPWVTFLFFLFYLHLLGSNPVSRLVRKKKGPRGFSRHHFYGKGLRCYGFCLLLGLAGGGGCQYIVFFPRYPLFLFLFTFASREYLFFVFIFFYGVFAGKPDTGVIFLQKVIL